MTPFPQDFPNLPAMQELPIQEVLISHLGEKRHDEENGAKLNQALCMHTEP